eukprot:CAMPEP_0197406792 /NCGR_PEP_ID=MMETSP1165-20131217/26234_1 /TAXON_ID=284809 /ORGANISM="Chrysocystis fragilis, Strain CCMP3189" /LENGTH=160 /DNA_ID=CAMNT_0042933153 /DNA_START=69 /DNA_END=550 /DNA_ORIENTATION=+
MKIIPSRRSAFVAAWLSCGVDQKCWVIRRMTRAMGDETTRVVSALNTTWTLPSAHTSDVIEGDASNTDTTSNANDIRRTAERPAFRDATWASLAQKARLELLADASRQRTVDTMKPIIEPSEWFGGNHYSHQFAIAFDLGVSVHTVSSEAWVVVRHTDGK